MQKGGVGARVRHGPFYFLAVLHPPPSPELHDELGEYAFTLNDLYKLAPKIPGLPLMVEHAGIVEAVESTKGGRGQLADRDAIYGKLHDLGESDATKSPVGRLISGEVVQPSGALYAIFQINEGLEWVAWLVRNGFLTGVSLTTLETTHGMRPYEVSLTRRPARPHCYIVFHSTELDKVQGYMRRVHNGSMRDLSATLTRPYRIMAASESAMETEKAAAAAPDVTGEMLLKAIQSHPESSNQELLMAGFELMTKRANENKEKMATELAAAQKAVEEANAARKIAEQRAAVNTTMMQSQLRAYRTTIPEGMPFDDALGKLRHPHLSSAHACVPPLTCFAAAEKGFSSDNVEDVRAAYGQAIMCASYSGFIENKKKRTSDEQATREKDEFTEDPLHTRMKALNELLSGASETATGTMLKASAAERPKPTTAGSSISLNPMDERVAAGMKLGLAFDAFKPLE